MTRKERIEKAERLSKSWEQLRLCKKIIEEEGTKWRKSAERREIELKQEEEKRERLAKARGKEEECKKRQVQKKITEVLEKLPENRREIIRREEEREKRILLKEAKEEMWRRWRQKKGRNVNGWKRRTPGREEEMKELNTMLDRAESELKTYEIEMERRTKEERERNKRLTTKREKEKKWEMMRWIVEYIEVNKNHWNIRGHE